MFTYMDDKFAVLDDTIISWSGTDASLRVPTIFNGHRVTKIGDGAFKSCYTLREVFINDGIEIIGEHAFSECKNLVNVVIPDSVMTIGVAAFMNCETLKSVTNSAKLKNVEKQAFYKCDIVKPIHFPSDMEGNVSFYDVMPQLLRAEIYVDFCVDNAKYEELEAKSIRLTDGRLLLTENAETVEGFSTLSKFNMPRHIDMSMRTIFLSSSPEVDVSNEISRNLFSWEGVPDRSTENDVVLRRIQDGEYIYCNDNDEKEWVAKMIKGQDVLPRSYSSAAEGLDFCIIDGVTHSENGQQTIGHIRAYKSYGFYIGVHKVVVRGVVYHIYSRYYLVGKYTRSNYGMGNNKTIYYRNDMAIYCGDKMITNKKLSEEIYAKYKLFSIL